MNSFLITYKPLSEAPEHGWPEEELRALVRKLSEGKEALEPWRFYSAKSSPGDRAYVLLQGRNGPAIIGYGHVAGARVKNDIGQVTVPVEFERLADPTEGRFLIGPDQLKAISDRYWSTQFSGRLVDDLEVVRQIEEALGLRIAPAQSNSAVDDLDDGPPKRTEYSGYRYARDPRIRDAVRARAAGRCEYCGHLGFLLDDKSSRYLECHHIRALAELKGRHTHSPISALPARLSTLAMRPRDDTQAIDIGSPAPVLARPADRRGLGCRDAISTGPKRPSLGALATFEPTSAQARSQRVALQQVQDYHPNA